MSHDAHSISTSFRVPIAHLPLDRVSCGHDRPPTTHVAPPSAPYAAVLLPARQHLPHRYRPSGFSTTIPLSPYARASSVICKCEGGQVETQTTSTSHAASRRLMIGKGLYTRKLSFDSGSRLALAYPRPPPIQSAAKLRPLLCSMFRQSQRQSQQRGILCSHWLLLRIFDKAFSATRTYFCNRPLVCTSPT